MKLCEIAAKFQHLEIAILHKVTNLIQIQKLPLTLVGLGAESSVVFRFVSGCISASCARLNQLI